MNRKHSAVQQAYEPRAQCCTAGLRTTSTVLYSTRYKPQAQCCTADIMNRKHSGLSDAGCMPVTFLHSWHSHSAGLQLQWASNLLNPFPDTTKNSCLQITVSIFKSILLFLQSKWTALHVLFFSNSVTMVPKLTHVNSHNLVPWTLRTLTEHWTPTLRSCQEQH
jgi:hypothetical protein